MREDIFECTKNSGFWGDMMMGYVHRFLGMTIVIFSMAACKGTWTLEECTVAGSEDCNSCISLPDNSYQTCTYAANSFDPEHTLRPDEYTNSCSDGGEFLEAYKQGWTNRGCSE